MKDRNITSTTEEHPLVLKVSKDTLDTPSEHSFENVPDVYFIEYCIYCSRLKKGLSVIFSNILKPKSHIYINENLLKMVQRRWQRHYTSALKLSKYLRPRMARVVCSSFENCLDFCFLVF